MDKVYNVKGVNIDKIKALAKEQGKTMTFICGVLGKSPQFLSSVRNGRDYIDNYELQLIADELQTTASYLTDQTEQKEKPTVQTDDELDPEIEELLDLLEQMHPDDLKQIIDFAKWLIAKNKPEGV